MKKFKTNSIAALSLGAMLLTGVAMSNVAFGHGDEPHEGDKPHKEAPKAQQVKVTIDGGFRPGKITVHPGRPVHLTLVRKEHHGCGNIVKFPGLTETVDGKEVVVQRTLKTGETATVTFTPTAKGTLHFTCGMGMYKGAIVVK